MKYVLDSNVALKTVLPEVDSARAIQLITAFKQGVHELVAPDIFPVEVGHALTRAEPRSEFSHPMAGGFGMPLWRMLRVCRPICR